MNWINIHTDTLRDSIFIGAEPLERATWICLLGWSCTQENGGVIEDCKTWSDRRWQQTCGVTKEEIENGDGLFFFQGNDLVITYYPKDHENTVKSKREAGKKGGRPIHSKSKNHEVNHMVNQEDITIDNHMANLERTLKKDKVKKSNEKEEKENSVCDEVFPKKKSFQFPNYPEFEAYLIQAMPLVNPEWTPERVKRASRLQYDTYEENGWKDGNNNQVKNWKTKAKTALSYKNPWNFGSDQSKPTPQTFAEINAKAKEDQFTRNLQNPLW